MLTLPKQRKYSKVHIDMRVIVAMTGLVLSIVLHELFHVYMHWGDIQSVGILTHPGTIAEVISTGPREYDVVLEELVAYTITAVVMMVTFISVWKIHDLKDDRTFGETLFPKGSPEYDMQVSELVELGYASHVQS